MKLLFRSTTFLILFLGSVSCTRETFDSSYVKSSLWAWDKGYRIGDGDFVEFDSSNFFFLSHDTILREGVPKCVILEVNKKYFEMEVRSFSGELGYYRNTAESTQ